MPDETPAPPLSIAEGAVALHESYTSFLAAGFTEHQALYLIGQMLRGASSGSPR